MYHIEKEQKIQNTVQKIYLQDINRWTTVFEECKTYSRKEDATKELSAFGGIVVAK